MSLNFKIENQVSGPKISCGFVAVGVKWQRTGNIIYYISCFQVSPSPGDHPSLLKKLARPAALGQRTLHYVTLKRDTGLQSSFKTLTVVEPWRKPSFTIWDLFHSWTHKSYDGSQVKAALQSSGQTKHEHLLQTDATAVKEEKNPKKSTNAFLLCG